MPEISLNILDVAQNSVKAKAARIEISVRVFTKEDRLVVEIRDNGSGMDETTLANVTDPFFTTRKTRKVGLGVSFFKLAAETTGGSFTIGSEPGTGTDVCATFVLSSFNRMPLGSMTDTMVSLITMNPDRDFCYRYEINGEGFTLDTAEMREILGEVPLNTPEVASYIRDFLDENTASTNLVLAGTEIII